MADEEASPRAAEAEFLALLNKLRSAYNDFDLPAASACRSAMGAEEARQGLPQCAPDGGARTVLVAEGMRRNREQQQRVMRCLLEHFGFDANLATRYVGDDSNWLGRLHGLIMAMAPKALLRLYCDCEPSEDEAATLARFATHNKAPTLAHRERGQLSSFAVSVMAKLLFAPLQRCSFAIPNEAALVALARRAPLVEMGAGTGYWSALLQQRGVCIAPFDAQPPSTDSNNAFFGHTFTDVMHGDASLFGPAASPGGDREAGAGEGRGAVDDLASRALLLTWPNNPDADDNPHLLAANAPGKVCQPTWDANCLQRYVAAGGATVCYVGEREAAVRVERGRRSESGASATRAFQRMLAQHYALAETHPLPCWPHNCDDLTIWVRKRAVAGADIGADPAPAFVLRDAVAGELWRPEHRPVDEDTQPLILRHLLSDDEIDQLLNAAGPAYPPRAHHLLRGTTTGPAAVHDVAESAGHRKLFLHRGDHFGRDWPLMSSRLVQAMCSQPGFPRSGGASALSVRCAEFHTYHSGDGLMARGHRDRGSTLTLSVLLSDPAACGGGEFLTWAEDGTVPIRHVLGRGDAILFHSEKTHNVAPLTNGVRYALVIELWRLPEGREGENVYDRNR